MSRKSIRLNAFTSSVSGSIKSYYEKDTMRSQRWTPDVTQVIEALGAIPIAYNIYVHYKPSEEDLKEFPTSSGEWEKEFFFGGMCKITSYDHATYIDIWMFDDGEVVDIIPCSQLALRKIADRKMARPEIEEYIKTKLIDLIIQLDALDEKNAIIKEC